MLLVVEACIRGQSTYHHQSLLKKPYSHPNLWRHWRHTYTSKSYGRSCHIPHYGCREILYPFLLVPISTILHFLSLLCGLNDSPYKDCKFLVCTSDVSIVLSMDSSVILNHHRWYLPFGRHIVREQQDAVQRSKRLSMCTDLNKTSMSLKYVNTDDLVIYTRWLICHLHSVKHIHSFIRVRDNKKYFSFIFLHSDSFHKSWLVWLLPNHY